MTEWDRGNSSDMGTDNGLSWNVGLGVSAQDTSKPNANDGNSRSQSGWAVCDLDNGVCYP
jgi:hypothetical protein